MRTCVMELRVPVDCISCPEFGTAISCAAAQLTRLTKHVGHSELAASLDRALFLWPERLTDFAHLISQELQLDRAVTVEVEVKVETELFRTAPCPSSAGLRLGTREIVESMQ